MQIGEVSKLTGLSYHTLRYYEKVGLIRNISRNEQDKREYTEKDVEWINFLVSLKKAKMPLSEFARYAELYYCSDSCTECITERVNLLEVHKNRLIEQIGELQDSVDYLGWKVSKLNGTLINLDKKHTQSRKCM